MLVRSNVSTALTGLESLITGLSGGVMEAGGSDYILIKVYFESVRVCMGACAVLITSPAPHNVSSHQLGEPQEATENQCVNVLVGHLLGLFMLSSAGRDL